MLAIASRSTSACGMEDELRDNLESKLFLAIGTTFKAIFSPWIAHKLGLIDGIADVRSKMREIHGEKIALKVVPMAKKSL
ncbi:MAG: hypothetical protein AAFQ11_08535, partial [Pseudomonadota bacterium]